MFGTQGPDGPKEAVRPAARWRGDLRRALTCGLAATALAAATAPAAFAVGHGVYPTEVPTIYPGTTQAIDAWRLIGGGQASATQVAPRWVLATGHAPADGGIWTKDRGSAGATTWFMPRDATGARIGDISLTLLSEPLPAPATGFPRLLEETPSKPLLSVLPGQVLFAGFGGVTADRLPEPKVGWATPSGEREPGQVRLQAIGGDSGSAAFWFPTPTSAPVIRAITSGEFLANQAPWTFSDQGGFSGTFPQTPVGSNATTVAEWLREQFAKHPEATPPQWVTLDELVPLAALRPMQPGNFRPVSATSSSVLLRWEHADDARVPRTGYRLTRPGSIVNLPAGTTEYRVTGLTAGQSYDWELRAVNDNGVSPDRFGETSTVSYAVRQSPGPARNLSLTGERSLGAGQVADYCLRAAWDAPTEVAGAPVTSYVVLFDGEPTTTSLGLNGRSPRFCGLDPNTTHVISVQAKSDLTLSNSTVNTSNPTPAGVPRGTPIPAPTNVVATTRLSTTSGSVDYCLDVSWKAPTAVSGWPVTSYNVLLMQSGYGAGATNGLPATSTKHTACELEPDSDYRAVVWSNYGATAATSASSTAVVTPNGAPFGTPLTPVRNLVAPIVTRFLASSCANVAWAAPTAIQGVPVTSQSVVITPAAGGSPVAASASLSASATAVRLCGLVSTRTYTVTHTTRYAGGGTAVATGVAKR